MKINKYNTFIKENMEQAKSIIGKKMEAFDKLKTLLSKNIGYIGKFTEYLMEENIGYDDLVQLYNDLVDLKNRNNPLDISKLKFEKATDKVIYMNNKIIVNSLVNQFPSEQKKLAKELIDSSSNFNIFLIVAKKENLKAFISKISRYKDSRSLLNAMELFSKDPENEREYVKELIGKMDSSIVFENDSIIVVNVPTITDIQVLGSDTSWCILRQSNWSSYTKNRYQYILYDYSKDEYDPEFKIGFTLEKNGELYTAHDILDSYCVNSLRKTINENGITFIELIPTYKKADAADIDKISSKSSLTSIELLVSSIKDDEKDILYKLLIKLFDLFGYYKTDRKGIVTNKELTHGRILILSSIVKKIFSEKLKDYNTLIFPDDFKNMDSRVLKYVKEREMFRDTMFDMDKIPYSPRRSIVEYGVDKWSDKVFATWVSGCQSSYFIESYNPLKLKFTKETTIKISDRINKIYSDGKIKFSRKQFACNVIFLNYILGRPEKCPDVENLLNMVKNVNSLVMDYPGLFTNEISLDNASYVTISSIPIDILVKKDYPDCEINVNSQDMLKVQELLKHLDGYEILLRMSETTVYNFRKGQWYKPENLDEYGEKFLALLNKLPGKIKSKSSVNDGKLTVKVT